MMQTQPKSQENSQNELAKRLLKPYKKYIIGIGVIVVIALGIILYIFAQRDVLIYYVAILSFLSFLKFIYSSEDIKTNLNKN